MEVDVLIDRITNCLIDTRTGEEVETEYRLREMPIKPNDYKGWKSLQGEWLFLKMQHKYC